METIAFTGSRAIGTLIYDQAGRRRPGQRSLKRVIAEMGGKNAIIIGPDADLDEAVLGTVGSAFGYAGQKCSACSRVIVDRRIAGQFVPRLIDAAASLIVGPSSEPETVVGPLIDQPAKAKVMEYIEVGRQEGRQLYCAELGSLATRGHYVPPAVFEVGPDARIAREEIFGPVLAVTTAADFEQAIRMANDTDYALTGGVYSRSPADLDRARRELNVGNLYINRKITGALVDRQPFGGFKMSGVGGKAGGPDYLLQFLEPRTITENTLRQGFAPVGG